MKTYRILFITGLIFTSISIWAQQKSTIHYKGFIDTGYSIGIGKRHLNRLELSTTHGCTIGNHLFTGIGIGIQRYEEDNRNLWSNMIGIPVFGHIRYQWAVGSLTTFASMKMGYTFNEIKGEYLAPSVGCRLPLGGNQGLNFSLGYSLQRHTFHSSDPIINPDGSIYLKPYKKNLGAINIGLAYDF